MPTKRTRAPRRRQRIMPDAVAAWRVADYMALHKALNLRPWEPSPLPRRIDALGVDPRHPPEDEHRRDAWRKAVELQGELMAVAGSPKRRQ